MNKMTKKMMLLAAGLTLSAGLTAGSVQAAPAPAAKVSLPVVKGARAITAREKAATAGQGLLDLNVTALNGLNVANNLNVLNIGSFNKWINKSSDCGCGIGPS